LQGWFRDEIETRFHQAQILGGSPVTLDATPFGKPARVVSVKGDGPIALRLMQMGVVPGVSVSVVKSAPLGDPIQIRVRDFDLALRRLEARTITVSLDDE
jgi:Fe2+ transport system protein FeoA